MKKKDIITLVIFVLLILAIIGVFIVHNNKNRKLDNVDRKVEYIFDNYSYDAVYKVGEKLFFQTIDLLNGNGLEYEKNSDGQIKLYSINNYNNYKKITNSTQFTNIFSDLALNDFMKYKKIIKHENNYYVELSNNTSNKYIGSIVDIVSYDTKYVYFTAENYYCDNYNYIGKIKEVPSCNYTKDNTSFVLLLEQNNLKMNSIEELKLILK